MYQSVKLTGAIWPFTAGNLLPSHSCSGVTWVKSRLGFEHGSPAWEVDDLPTELSLPPWILKSNADNCSGSS